MKVVSYYNSNDLTNHSFIPENFYYTARTTRVLSLSLLLFFTKGGKLRCATCKLVFSMEQRVNEAEGPSLNGWMLAPRGKALAFSFPSGSLFRFCLYRSILYTTVGFALPFVFDHCIVWSCQTCLCCQLTLCNVIDRYSIDLRASISLSDREIFSY